MTCRRSTIQIIDTIHYHFCSQKQTTERWIYEDAGHEALFITETLLRAPLNSRVGASASIPKTKGKTNPLILEDLYVLMHLSLYYTPFVESCSHLDFRLVNHALCAAIRTCSKHPSSLSSSESHPKQAARDEAFWRGVAKLKAVLSDMKKSTSDVPINVKSGEVLTVICERMQTMSGNGTLLIAAGMPYVEMFRVRTTTGRFEDPYKKLCIKESSMGISEWLRDGSTHSSKRQHTSVPPPRTVGVWKHKFLLAGKYFNVVRECGIERYFFLASSSFLTHLLDLAHIELRKPAKGKDAAFREDVRVSIASSGFVSGVIGGEEGEGNHGREKDDKKAMLGICAIDALTLHYTVKFPRSLFYLTSVTRVLRHQVLDRFLILKHVEQLLSSMWIERKTSSWRRSVSNHLEFEQWRLRVALLRARMIALVQQILAFATFEVFEPNWCAPETKSAKATTVDQLLRGHIDFLDICLKECMLTSAELLRVCALCMTVTCSIFALYTSFTQSGDADQAMNKR
ncbi:Spc98 family-domain-containing protein [Suillus subalutaceus]|uniref:Spc98 family-domain-containing protein n=1 Tax=Suillus subalutaceus TaxID=48586 RepID=UPI001B872E34|nr:Spc98 family-domain-containing protein [Suillus subalutaceus]KAG1842874.1 Spc98 family-domain-containing protein [Suillus subalutaceus]